MIAKATFIETLQAIKQQEDVEHEAEIQLRKLGLTIDIESRPYLRKLIDILHETVPDPYDYIGWWLYEAADDYEVSWDEGDQHIVACLKDPGDLYDFLMREKDKTAFEELPLINLPEECHHDRLLHKGIEEVNFGNYLDPILRYVDLHDVVIDIMQDGKPKYMLISIKLFNRLSSTSDKPHGFDPSTYDVIQLEVDPELECAARERLEGTGFTLEQVTEMFLSWCALYPDDSAKWLEWARAEQEKRDKAEIPRPEGGTIAPEAPIKE